jgi:hypothetical protein
MRVITTSELKKDLDKYLNIARDEHVLLNIQKEQDDTMVRLLQQISEGWGDHLLSTLYQQ